MRPKTLIGGLSLSDLFAIVLVLTLAVTAALTSFSLLVEVTGFRVSVVAQQPPAMVASEAVIDESVGLGDAVAVADRSGPPIAAGSAEVRGVPTADAPEGSTSTGAPMVGALTTAPAPSPVPSPAGAVAAAPSPTPVVARVRPTPGPRGAPRSSADVPIVMYHHVGSLPPDADVFRCDLTASPDLFERTLQQLADDGVETVTMADLFEHFAGGPALPKKAAILTFDDGYDDNFEHAFRLLEQYGMVGTFFITTDFVEQPGYVTWAQVAEMAKAGMEIAAHSANHADMAAIGPNELRRQLVEPKALLEEATGQNIRFLAYPAGKYNQAVIAATRAAGYEAAVTVLHGTRHTPSNAFELHRVRARGADTVAQIVGRMTPASWDP